MSYYEYMDAVSYTFARNNLAELTDRVCADHAPILITRQGAPTVVMISLADYTSLEETAYLLRSPKNAARLGEAIYELEAGGGKERHLSETE